MFRTAVPVHDRSGELPDEDSVVTLLQQARLLPEMRFASAQLFLGLLTLNGDARKMRDLLDDFLVGWARAA